MNVLIMIRSAGTAPPRDRWPGGFWGRGHRVHVDPASGSVSADGLPSVIMMIWRMSLRCDSSMRRDSLSPSAVFVWYGPLGGPAGRAGSPRPCREQDHTQRVARKLRADQVGERERHFLGRREAVLAVQDHGVRAVEHEHRGRRRAVLGLVHHEVVVLEVDRHAQPLALQRVRQRGVHVEVERVAVLVGLAHRVHFDAGREMLGLVRPEARLANASQQVFQGSVAEKSMPFSVRLNCTCWAASLAIPPGPNSGCCPAGTLGASVTLR